MAARKRKSLAKILEENHHTVKVSHPTLVKQLLPPALKKDIDFIDEQINVMSLTVGHLKAEDQYSIRQQMLELLRFKYTLLGCY